MSTDTWFNIHDLLPAVGSEVIAIGTWRGEICGDGSRDFMGMGEWMGNEVSLPSDTYGTFVTDVTHWMPAPKPPNRSNK